MTRVIKIKDISIQIRGVSYSKNDAISKMKDGYIPVLRANNIQEQGLVLDDFVYVPVNKVSDKQRILAGDVIIAASSGSIDVVGKAASAKQNMNAGFGAFCKILRPNTKLVDARYFANYFQTQKYRQVISSLAAGANINNLRNEHLDDLEIPLPPLPEQRRIAAILDKADALRQKRKQAIAKLDQLLQATFIEMFGDPVTNPNNIEQIELDEFILHGPQNGLYKPANMYGRGTPIVRIDGFKSGDIIDNKEFKRLSLEESDIDKYKLNRFDLVINRVNSPEYIGKTALVRNLEEATVFESNMMRLSVDCSKLDPYYLNFFLKQQFILNQIANKRKDAVNQSSINQQDVKSFIINVPPIESQLTFSYFFQKIEKNKNLFNQTSINFDNLFNSLQNQAFNGTL